MTRVRALVPTRITAGLVGSLLVAFLASAARAVDDPFARWTFDASNGNDAVGTLHLATQGPVAYVNGRSGKVARLDGASSWLDRASDPAFVPGTDGWTTYAWVLAKPDPSDVRMILSWYRCGANPGCGSSDAALYFVYLGLDGRPVVDFRDDASHDVEVVGPTPVTDARWHLIVGTLDQTLDRVRLYVDGVAVKESTTTITSFNAGGQSIPLSIGRLFRQGWASPAYYFKGSVDDVRLYRRALSAAEVAALYSAGVVGVDPPGSSGAGIVSTGLGAAFPNPLRRGNVTSVRVSLAEARLVRVAVFDVLGRRVRTLVDGRRDAGEFVAAWDGADETGVAARPGVYFVRMELDGERGERGTTVTIVR